MKRQEGQIFASLGEGFQGGDLKRSGGGAALEDPIELVSQDVVSLLALLGYDFLRDGPKSRVIAALICVEKRLDEIAAAHMLVLTNDPFAAV
ncbi:MAG: hypothetical protein ACRD88_12940 [Terriglobia bacterium]